MMHYKGYIANIVFDDDQDLFHGEVINTRDVITFQGKSVDDLKEALQDSIEDYLEFCAERGEEPDKPFSGRFNIRLSPDVHKEAVVEANRSGKSLNSWVSDAIVKALHHKGSNQSSDRAQ